MNCYFFLESRTKDRNKEVIEKTDVTKEQIVFSDTLQYWGGEISAVIQVRMLKFTLVKITAHRVRNGHFPKM